MDDSDDVTRLLHAWHGGQCTALDSLLPLVYADLRRLARVQLGRHAGHGTLQPTALVNDVFVRLLGPDVQLRFSDRRHFFNLSTRVMRQLLVDRARAGLSDKRGGHWRREDIDAMPDLAMPEHTRLPELDDALQRLAELHPRMAEVVQLRYFGGFTEGEIAELLEITERTVRRDWAAARAWLRRELQDAA